VVENTMVGNTMVGNTMVGNKVIGSTVTYIQKCIININISKKSCRQAKQKSV